MRLTLALPHALPQEALAGMAAFARLASYGRRDGIAGDLDVALVEAAGAPRGTPIAPLAARGAGLDPGSAYVLRADPVALVAGRDDVLLAGRVDDLEHEDAVALVGVLNAHFATDGLVFRAPRADTWFVTALEHVPVDADPIESNEPIHPRLPRGRHGATWRRWLSEMQMLLHAHPVNAAREAAGRAPVTGIWISGGGFAPRDLRLAPIEVYAAAGRAGDVARGLAALAGLRTNALPSSLEAADRDALFVLPAAIDAAAFARDWLDPGVAALERGALSGVTLLVAGTAHLRAESPSWWRRLRAKARQ
ncbi:MAG TPA: hypothetical protein VMN56_00405 [Casimicrobiaceae bacterium]|nr:hypothetical protein [Casimicrobiaceae bacterium]